MNANEIWMLWNDPTPEQIADDPQIAPCFVRALDGGHNIDCYMAFLTEAEAVSEAARQNDMYDLNCKAVRVK